MKKALALILSLLMVLALVPSAFAAGEVAVAMTTAPATGDKVVIYYPTGGTLISSVASGDKLTGVAATVSNNSIVVPANAAMFDVTVNEANEYAFSLNGKYLTTAQTGSTLTFADTLTDLGLWILEPVEGKGYLIKKTNGDVWQTDLWQAGMGIVDFTNPDAWKWYQDKLRNLLSDGVDCIKTDFGERIPTDVHYYDGSDPAAMHNYYT